MRVLIAVSILWVALMAYTLFPKRRRPKSNRPATPKGGAPENDYGSTIAGERKDWDHKL